jgi:hypothetical protein
MRGKLQNFFTSSLKPEVRREASQKTKNKDKQTYECCENQYTTLGSYRVHYYRKHRELGEQPKYTKAHEKG